MINFVIVQHSVGMSDRDEELLEHGVLVLPATCPLLAFAVRLGHDFLERQPVVVLHLNQRALKTDQVVGSDNCSKLRITMERLRDLLLEGVKFLNVVFA